MKPSHLPPAFYDHLLPWELLHSIVVEFEEDQHTTVWQKMMEALDIEILNEILHHLDNDHHPDFLQLCLERHHHPSLLDWLEERKSGISLLIVERVKNNHSDLQVLLINSD